MLTCERSGFTGWLSAHVHVRLLGMQDKAGGERRRVRPGQGRQLGAGASHSVTSEQNSGGSEV